MVIVVRNILPLSYWHQIMRLSLVQSLYEEIIISPAVANELRAVSDCHVTFDCLHHL
jgi:predicted nucleic acid-binding protein